MLYEFDRSLSRTLSDAISLGPTDEELMGRLQAGDESALTDLYRRHSPLLRSIISRVINNDYDVDDILQDAFTEIWRLAGHYDPEKGKALGWIVTLTRRRAIDRLRKKQAYHRAEERLRLEVKAVDEGDMECGADEAAIADDRTEIFRKAIASLPSAQQEAIRLAFYGGLSQREISTRTGTPLGTIKTRLELGIRKLRTALMALGGRTEWSMAGA